MSITGGCLCGAITYRVEGALRDARSCHCSRCRKAFSAQASAYALVDADQFRWMTGEEQLTTYKTGNDFGLQFCQMCGSTLCGLFENRVHGITLGCVDGDPDVELGMHIFVGSRARWETIPAGVKQYQEGPPGQDDSV